jgi:glycosyltransferase involved in cell wall biosynthesis
VTHDGEAGAPVLALVPARDEAERVGATVRALRDLPGVAEVLVVSDGSTDATAARALEAGAHCLDLPRNIGKGGALNAGLAALMGRVAERLSPEPAALLLADADLAETAGRLDRLLDPVLAGEADWPSPTFPPSRAPAGSAWPWPWPGGAWPGPPDAAWPSPSPASAPSAGRPSPPCCRSPPGSGSRWP